MRLILAIISLISLSACVQLHSGDTYSRSNMGRIQTVMRGKVLAIRDVKISGTNSGIGAGSGALAGGAAGAAIGGNANANIVGAVGGALVGGIAGAAAEKALTEANAMEFVIQQENGEIVALVQANTDNLQVGDSVLILRAGRARITKDTTS